MESYREGFSGDKKARQPIISHKLAIA